MTVEDIVLKQREPKTWAKYLVS